MVKAAYYRKYFVDHSAGNLQEFRQFCQFASDSMTGSMADYMDSQLAEYRGYRSNMIKGIKQKPTKSIARCPLSIGQRDKGKEFLDKDLHAFYSAQFEAAAEINLGESENDFILHGLREHLSKLALHKALGLN